MMSNANQDDDNELGFCASGMKVRRLREFQFGGRSCVGMTILRSLLIFFFSVASIFSL